MFFFLLQHVTTDFKQLFDRMYNYNGGNNNWSGLLMISNLNESEHMMVLTVDRYKQSNYNHD